MNQKYIHVYNNLINFSRNKDLYINLNRQDNFSDRLIIFLLHFAFLLKNFKNEENKIVLQEIYDFIFRQLELSIREIGYGDQSINKKMKDYINLFHSMVSEIHFWDNLIDSEKQKKISKMRKIRIYCRKFMTLISDNLNLAYERSDMVINLLTRK